MISIIIKFVFLRSVYASLVGVVLLISAFPNHLNFLSCKCQRLLAVSLLGNRVYLYFESFFDEIIIY